MLAADGSDPRSRTPDLEMRRAAVAGIELFRAMRPNERDAVLAGAGTRRFDKNAAVMRRGEDATGMMVILQGKLRVSVISPEGQEVSLGMLGPGDVLGEMALLDGGTRSADVNAVEECVVLTIQRAHFLELLRNNADLCLRLVRVLSQRVRQSNAFLEEIATLDLGARLGRLLARLAGSYGKEEGGAIRINMKLSQKDLSTLVIGSREKVNRQLRQWEKDGVLSNEHGYILIHKMTALVSDSG